jgi:ElaB/YqjD/DUF883 family membrane-anchored ribosome-binding protein
MENTQSMVKDGKKVLNGAVQGTQDRLQKTTEFLSQAGARVQDTYEELGGQAQEWADQSVKLIKRYPLYTVLGAAAVGFLAGAIIRRR